MAEAWKSGDARLAPSGNSFAEERVFHRCYCKTQVAGILFSIWNPLRQMNEARKYCSCVKLSLTAIFFGAVSVLFTLHVVGGLTSKTGQIESIDWMAFLMLVFSLFPYAMVILAWRIVRKHQSRHFCVAMTLGVVAYGILENGLRFQVYFFPKSGLDVIGLFILPVFGPLPILFFTGIFYLLLGRIRTVSR